MIRKAKREVIYCDSDDSVLKVNYKPGVSPTMITVILGTGVVCRIVFLIKSWELIFCNVVVSVSV